MTNNVETTLKEQVHLIILGAGAPHVGQIPTVLSETTVGISVLDWTLKSSKSFVAQTTFIGGYQVDAIRAQHPELRIIENQDWARTGSGASLLLGILHEKQPLLACYGDILFRSSVLESMNQSNADIVIAYDSGWQHRYEERDSVELAKKEKVRLRGHFATRLGPDLPTDCAHGEFVGLVKFSEKAVSALCELRDNPPESLKTKHLSEYVEFLRMSGFHVEAVDISGHWAECNHPKDISNFVFGTKAETLARLEDFLKHGTIKEQVTFTTRQWHTNYSDVLNKVRGKFSNSKLVVRSSAKGEDSFNYSNAGGYDSVLNVSTDDEFFSAVNRVIGSYGQLAEPDEQILVQPMVENVTISGVVFTRTLADGAPWYSINYDVNGNTEAITSGESKDHQTLIIRRGKLPGAVKSQHPALSSLLKCVQEIEHLLLFDELDIEFAIDNHGIVFILQVRPIAVQRCEDRLNDSDYQKALNSAHKKWIQKSVAAPHLPGNAPQIYGNMPDWNPAEIIGTAPGALSKSLYKFLIMDDIWAIQRSEYGYRDVRPSPLLHTFLGQPYVDVRASFASFIPANLQEDLAGKLLEFYVQRLVNNQELHDKIEFEVVPTCLTTNFKKWANILENEGGFVSEEIKALYAGLQRITNVAFERTANDIQSLSILSDRFNAVKSLAGLSDFEKLNIILADCRRFGTLPFAHLARSGFVAVTLLKDAVASKTISREGFEGFMSTIRTVSHEITEDAYRVKEGQNSWELFVEKYGHLRPGTYEITSKKYADAPEHFLQPIVENSRKTHEHDTKQQWDSEKSKFFEALSNLGLPSDEIAVETFLRSAIEGRELSKFLFTKNLSAVLDLIVSIGENFGIPTSDLSDIPLQEIQRLEDMQCFKSEAQMMLTERAKLERYNTKIAMASQLPPILSKADDFDFFTLSSDSPNFIGSDAVTAMCVQVTDQPTDLNGKIAIIPQADPGYDWLFGQGIVGLVTQYGGANSHMAIRSAEFGLPAAIGVGANRYSKLSEAQLIELSPGSKIVRVIR